MIQCMPLQYGCICVSPGSTSKLLELSAVFISVRDSYINICDNDIVVGYTWHMCRVGE